MPKHRRPKTSLVRSAAAKVDDEIGPDAAIFIQSRTAFMVLLPTQKLHIPTPPLRDSDEWGAVPPNQQDRASDGSLTLHSCNLCLASLGNEPGVVKELLLVGAR
jgi:hypothetical protein